MKDIELLQTMRMRYETLLCFIYGYKRPTGENGATADVYDSLLYFTEKNEKGDYADPEAAWLELREVAGFLDDAFTFAQRTYQNDQHICDELSRCKYMLNNLSLKTINECIVKAGLALGV